MAINWNDVGLRSPSMLKSIFFITICMLVGCGKLAPEIKGTTKSDINVKASGEVKTTSEFVFKIDVTGCDKLTGTAQASCITETVKALGDLVTTIKQFACKDDACKLPAGATNAP